jgi:hypothetical protein
VAAVSAADVENPHARREAEAAEINGQHGCSPRATTDERGDTVAHDTVRDSASGVARPDADGQGGRGKADRVPQQGAVRHHLEPALPVVQGDTCAPN